MKKLLIFLISFVSLISLNSQIKTNILVKKIYWQNFDEECSGIFSDGSEIRFELELSTGSPSQIIHQYNCFQNNGGCGGGSMTVNYNTQVSVPNPFLIAIKLRGWEDDGGSNCAFDSDDDDGGDLVLGTEDLANFPPQKYATFYNNANGGNNVGAEIQAKYPFPTILPPTKAGTTLAAVLCPENPLTLYTNYTAPKTGVTYKWEYLISGAPSTINNFSNWKSFGSTNDTFINIGKLLDKFPELDTLQLQSNLITRVICINDDGQDTSGWSVHSVFPRAPRTSTILSFGTCVGQSNGKIELKNISTVNSQMRYILKNGPNNTCLVIPLI